MDLSQRTLDVAEMAEKAAAGAFKEIDLIARHNSEKVLEAFQNNRVSDSLFGGTTGYGYDDAGRETLENIYAEVFGAEDALVRLGIVNGTHAISCALFASLRPNETLLSVTGTPYDTLAGVIGLSDKGFGSLMDYAVRYAQVDMTEDGKADLDAIARAVGIERPQTVLIQRSRGYARRNALSIKDIEDICKTVRAIKPDTTIVVDNCYGEFVEKLEPTQVGADLVAGSLIKNPGGGLAPTGGYIAGKRELVKRAAARMTAPGIDGECGPTLGQSRLLFQGLFMAPHTVAQALKTAVFCAAVMERLGYTTSPGINDRRGDIIQMIDFGEPEPLLEFCRGIQYGAPVDSFVTPEPWDMPGYDCQVVMAAGAFVQGASIELSCDAPMREPYTAYLQGGLTYESGRLGVMLAVDRLLS